MEALARCTDDNRRATTDTKVTTGSLLWPDVQKDTSVKLTKFPQHLLGLVRKAVLRPGLSACSALEPR